MAAKNVTCTAHCVVPEKKLKLQRCNIANILQILFTQNIPVKCLILLFFAGSLWLILVCLFVLKNSIKN